MAKGFSDVFFSLARVKIRNRDERLNKCCSRSRTELRRLALKTSSQCLIHTLSRVQRLLELQQEKRQYQTIYVEKNEIVGRELGEKKKASFKKKHQNFQTEALSCSCCRTRRCSFWPCGCTPPSLDIVWENTALIRTLILIRL